MEQKESLLKTFVTPIFKENPIFVNLLGLCPVLVATQTFDKSFGIGLAVILVLFFTNLVISLIRKIVPNEVRIPVFIVIIATFVTVVEKLMQAFTPTLYDSLGVVVSLITVNCIVLGRGEAFASKNKPLPSILDGVGSGIGFMFACVMIGLVREFIGTGGLVISNPFTGKALLSFHPLADFAISSFTGAVGGFVTLGVLIGIFTLVRSHLEQKAALNAKGKETK